MNPFIIAEIGINHNGDMKITKELIDGAVDAGCDAVKFQKRTIELVYSDEELDVPRESPWGTTNREQKNGLEFGKDEYSEIMNIVKARRFIGLHLHGFGKSKILKQFDLKYNKIASAMLTYDDLLESVASEGKHTFISTGMSTMDEIEKAVNILKYQIVHLN